MLSKGDSVLPTVAAGSFPASGGCWGICAPHSQQAHDWVESGTSERAKERLLHFLLSLQMSLLEAALDHTEA